MGQYDVALKPGVNATAYANAVGQVLGLNYSVDTASNSSIQLLAILSLVATLTLLLAAVAGLGVLNTVVLQTRERVHDIGVFKAVGMTPRQTTAMVVCSMAGIGLVAGLIAIPAGIALHHYVLPVMGHAAQTAVPASVLNVYRPGSSSCSRCPAWSSRWRGRWPRRPGRPGPAPRSPCAPNREAK